MKFVVAIDGPAAAGKGTIARAIAENFDFSHLDTGLLYRATARRFLLGEDAVSAAQSLDASDFTGHNLRTTEIAKAASQVAAIPAVRAALVEFQRDFAQREGGAVIDGRDIGTVICPGADVKMYVTASDDVRAERRYQELIAKGTVTTYSDELADLRARDARDMERETSPLKPAVDSIILDTSELSIEQAVARAVTEIEAKLSV